MERSMKTGEQFSLWSKSSKPDTSTSRKNLFPEEWIKRNTLRPEVARLGGLSEVRRLMNQGVKASEIVIIHLGQ